MRTSAPFAFTRWDRGSLGEQRREILDPKQERLRRIVRDYVRNYHEDRIHGRPSWMAQIRVTPLCRTADPERLSLPAVRSRQEVPATSFGKHLRPAVWGTRRSPQSERPREALGPFPDGGASIQADLVWGETSRRGVVCDFPGALSPREKPTRQEQSSALSGIYPG